MSGYKWTEEEKAYLAEVVPGRSHKEILELMNERFNRFELGQIKGAINRYGLNTGRTGYFEKGQVPFNKGLKGYMGANRTSFKKGHRPRNIDPIGTEKLLADGYVWIKVDDKPKVPKKLNWVQKHRLVWQESNGPIPEDHCVMFLDGDKTNCDINNLTVISRAENVAMNKNNLNVGDPDLTKAGLNIVKLMRKITEVGGR